MVEELAVVVVRLESLLQRGASLNTSIDMPKVQLFVEDQKGLIIIHQRKHLFCIRPR